MVDWLIPFIGDRHVLKNLQLVLIKIYFDVGLKQLANVSGHKGETLKALSSSNFKRTHRFILESWEALYLYMYQKFLKAYSHSQEVQTIMANTIDNYSEYNRSFCGPFHSILYIILHQIFCGLMVESVAEWN